VGVAQRPITALAVPPEGAPLGASATATLWAIRAAAISIRLMGISILLESERAVFALFRFVPELSELANHIMHQNYVDV
jgi:hypothetical protein